MARGRPAKSEIRQRIIDILHVIGSGYGYDIHKIYIQIFRPCTRESVYYHLKKGVAIGELAVQETILEKGDYSWGSTVEKTYYILGPNATPREDEDIKRWAEKHQRLRKLTTTPTKPPAQAPKPISATTSAFF